jgi:hypothetical protein
MTKVNYPIRRSIPVESRSQRRWLLAALSTVSCCTLLAVAYGAELNDSGWAIATPSPLATGDKTHDLHQQIILRRVLEQTQQPLLQKPSPTSTAAQTNAEHGHTGLRFAIRPDGVEGWRPIGQSLGPHLGAPVAAPADENEAECDCSGETAPKTKPKQLHAATPAPALADAYGSLPGFTASDTDDEETCQGKTSEGFTGAQSEEITIEESATGDTTTTIEVDDTIDEATTAPTAEKPNTASTAKPVIPVQEEVAPPPPLTKQLMALRTRVRSVLSGYYRKTLNSHDNDPWEAMHGMLSYGINSRIRQGGPRGESITAVGWLCYNKPCKGQTLMYVNPQGEVRAKYGVGLQGHLGQLLAMLAQCHVSETYPIHVGNKEFTIRDLIESEKKTCYPKSELTFKLIALQHYIDLNDKWVNDQGVDWDMPRLVREEMAQPIRGAACGGTHRLSGLSLAVKTRIRRGEPLDGEYAKADEFVKKYQQYAFRLQNRDGSLSTSWFRGSGDDDDINRRIKTTGHILEWLCYSLTDEELRDQRTIRAVTYLANLMYSNYDNEWEVGPRSHATHALLLYDERVFRPFDKEGVVASYRPTPQVANSSQRNSTKR